MAVFSHGHLIRAFARWLGLRAADGRFFLLDPATANVMSYYRGGPAVKRWTLRSYHRILTIDWPRRVIVAHEQGPRSKAPMAIVDSESAVLVADGKGMLAADETPKTPTKRFDALSIHSTADTRRSYREMLFGAPGIARFISGVIMQDETIHQQSSIRTPFADVLTQEGIIPGIKVDTGAKRLAGTTAENITEGLDGLRDRLKHHAQMGSRLAKWRALIHIGKALPTAGCVFANAHALARYVALCQQQGLVPIVEPEVLMDGSHTIERCEEVTGYVLQATFGALFEQRVSLECC